MVKRIIRDACFGALVDVQEFFLRQVDAPGRVALETNTKNFVRLLDHFAIPLIVTLERPVDRKGGVPQVIAARVKEPARIFEKDFFDLTREEGIRTHLRGLRKKQAILAGCETDVCILQSCLGLLALGYEVYVVEELIFSASPDVGASIARMQAEGAVFLTYKTLYSELCAAVDDARLGGRIDDRFPPLPDDLPDYALQ